MLKSFTEGINMKSAIISVIVMFIFIFVSDWIIHGMFLKEHYGATAHLWRPEEEMGSKMWMMMLGQFIIAKYFTMIFIHGYKGTGAMEGVRFGLFIGLFVIGMNLITYSVQPITCAILCGWMIGGMIQSILGGVILTFVYKK